MNEREKKLLLSLIGIIVVGVVVRFVYPYLIRPMFDFGVQQAAADRELDALKTEKGDIERALQDKYATYVLRNGGTDPSKARDDLYECLNSLLQQVKLGNRKINPKPATIDRKTKVATLKISVGATGTFAQCVDFINAFYKIPYVARISSLQLDPTSALQRADHDEVRLDVEIEAMLLPLVDEWGMPAGKQPAEFNRVASADISTLRNWKPFSPFVQATPPPTPTPGPAKPTLSPTPPPPPDVPVWPDAEEYMVKMIVRYGTSQHRIQEVLIENVMDFSARYVSIGEPLDNGELVMVHALGVVVHKADEGKDFGYWVYPLGELLTARLRLEDAAGPWPEIYVAARQFLSGSSSAGAAPFTPHPLDQMLIQAAMTGIGGAEMELVGPPLPPEVPNQPESTVNGETALEEASTSALPDATQPNGAPQVEGKGSRRDADAPPRPAARRPGRSNSKVPARASGARANPKADIKVPPAATQRRRPGPADAKSAAPKPAPEVKPDEKHDEEADDVAPPE